MSAKLPPSFYANTLALAYPAEHTYKLALYADVPEFDKYDSSNELDSFGYEAGGKVLSGYQIVDHGDAAALKFDTTNDWFNATIRARAAVVYDADTGQVLSILDFGREVGVIGGLFTVNLHAEGVVWLGESERE